MLILETYLANAQVIFLVSWIFCQLATDFCESKYTESQDREWDFSRKFLRVENENESSRAKIESWEWEWEFWGENEIEIEYETSTFQEWGLIKT